MKLGIQIPSFTFPGGPQRLGADLARIATAADEGGFDVISVMDHFFQIEMVGPPEQEMLEAYTTLGYLAAHTKRATLMTLVTGAIYREPGLLAKIVSTLDVLSEGRAMLGVGAGWNQQESEGLGFAFPSMSERFERLEECLQICLQMWSDDDGPYKGEHFSLGRTLNSPQSLSRPHPPILIGGSGEKKTLRLVAKYAQACNLFPGTQEEMKHKLDVLRKHCENEGTDYDAILKTTFYMMDTTKTSSQQMVDELGQLAEWGFDLALGGVMEIDTIAPLEKIAAEVIPAIAAL
jgi:F420-dependent oxidoreductase-like protein